MPPKPNLVTPGEMLAAARHELGVDLPEMEVRTKITRQILAAIEKDEYHKVSGELYVKSFLRTYAVAVGLEPEEILRLYSEFSGEARASGTGLTDDWTEEVQITRIGLPWPRIILAVALVLIGVGVIVLVALRGGDEETAATSRLEGAPAATAEQATGPETASAADTGADSVAAGAPEGAAASGETSREIPPARTVTAPAAPAANAVRFADGRTWSLVLRILCPDKQTLGVKRDAERDFRPALWPVGAEADAPVPDRGVTPGRAYRVREGWALYWGADDHFSLRLGEVTDVEVSVNDVVQNLDGLRPGQELLLDARSAGR